jgi:hypothetical protein
VPQVTDTQCAFCCRNTTTVTKNWLLTWQHYVHEEVFAVHQLPVIVGVALNASVPQLTLLHLWYRQYTPTQHTDQPERTINSLPLILHFLSFSVCVVLTAHSQ